MSENNQININLIDDEENQNNNNNQEIDQLRTQLHDTQHQLASERRFSSYLLARLDIMRTRTNVLHNINERVHNIYELRERTRRMEERMRQRRFSNNVAFIDLNLDESESSFIENEENEFDRQQSEASSFEFTIDSQMQEDDFQYSYEEVENDSTQVSHSD
jgi:hypothetical protein